MVKEDKQANQPVATGKVIEIVDYSREANEIGHIESNTGSGTKTKPRLAVPIRRV